MVVDGSGLSACDLNLHACVQQQQATNVVQDAYYLPNSISRFLITGSQSIIKRVARPTVWIQTFVIKAKSRSMPLQLQRMQHHFRQQGEGWHALRARQYN